MTFCGVREFYHPVHFTIFYFTPATLLIENHAFFSLFLPFVVKMAKIAFEAIRIPDTPLAINVDDNLDKIVSLGKEMADYSDRVSFPTSQKFKNLRLLLSFTTL